MSYLTKDQYEKKMQSLRHKNIQRLRKRNLRAEKYKYYPKIKMPSTSKLVLLGVFLICIEILLFSEYVMIAIGDASALYALIGIPAALIPICLGYYSKAKAETRA